jgi:voltage-gated potassium channel
MIVPFEKDARFTRIHSWGDGLWWSVITVTGVGYGDVIPVTPAGRIIGATLSVIGVLGFSLIIAMFGLALSETRDRYYRMKLFEKLDAIDERMERLEKNNEYMLKNDLTDTTRKTEEDNPPL